jgi:hypothetical protein
MLSVWLGLYVSVHAKLVFNPPFSKGILDK